MSASRLCEIAQIRVSSARAMRALSEHEPHVLGAVDAAARGEIAQGEAEDILASHLGARESCIASMRSFDTEWRELSRDVASLPAAESDELQALSRDFLALLPEIESSDARFAAELGERRRQASVEIARADTGHAAHRAYGPRSDSQPRFTDRKG